MPVKWTAESHEALLAAIVGSGLLPSWGGDRAKAIVEAWPKNKGPAPTISALSQHLDALRRKHGVPIARARGDIDPAPLFTRAAPSSHHRGRIPSASTSRATSAKAGREAHHVALLDSSGDEDDEFTSKPEATSAEPAAKKSRRRSVLAGSRVTELPRATLSPSTGLKDPAVSSRKRLHMDSPMIVVKEETQIDLTSDGDGQSNDDPFRGLPMGERQQMLKKKRQEELRKLVYSRQTTAVESGDDDEF